MPPESPPTPIPPFESTGRRVKRAELDPALQPYIHEVYEEEITLPPGQTGHAQMSAATDPVVHVVWSGDLVVRMAPGRGIPPFRHPPFTISGPQPEAYEVDFSGAVQGFYIRFTPVGPFALLGVRDYGLGERGAPALHEVVRPALAEATRRWGEALLAAPDFLTRMALTDQFLRPLAAVVEPGTAFLQKAVAAIEQAEGNVRIAALARQLGVSPSTLRRRFNVLGLPVKRFAGVLRFRQAHAYLHATPGATWTDVVHRFGYADQAHFVRAYRRYSGGPPTSWDAEARIVDRRLGIEGDFEESVRVDNV